MLRYLPFVLAFPGFVSAVDFKPEPGYALLFNGTDLTGWQVAPTKDKDKEKAGEALNGKKESPTKRFTVKDETLVIDPKVKGDITLFTEKTFAKDAHIQFDFKPGKDCNNDLFFRGMKFDIKESDIKNLKAGEWNSFEIVVAGENAEFKCNGDVIKKMKAKPAATTFGIRAEFGAIELRHLRIKSE
jgi:hypothetical protein